MPRHNACSTAGIARLRVADYETAAATFGTLVDYCPDYAEGYNQRAFARFLMGEFEAALPDLGPHAGACTRANPPARSRGLASRSSAWAAAPKARTRSGARSKLNPWLAERHLLTEPPGTDLMRSPRGAPGGVSRTPNRLPARQYWR